MARLGSDELSTKVPVLTPTASAAPPLESVAIRAYVPVPDMAPVIRISCVLGNWPPVRPTLFSPPFSTISPGLPAAPSESNWKMTFVPL